MTALALPSFELIAKVRRGIIFSAPLVLAILGDQKTVTRRLDRSWLKLEVGDLLAMRETIRFAGTSAPRHPGGDDTVDSAVYAADDSPVYRLDAWPWQNDVLPSIHMPHALTRAVLRVTEPPRLEPVQDITPHDVVREGVARLEDHRCGCEVCSTTSILCPGTQGSLLMEFCGVWQHLHDKEGQRWDDNPEVVRIAFERVEAV